MIMSLVALVCISVVFRDHITISAVNIMYETISATLKSDTDSYLTAIFSTIMHSKNDTTSVLTDKKDTLPLTEETHVFA